MENGKILLTTGGILLGGFCYFARMFWVMTTRLEKKLDDKDCSKHGERLSSLEAKVELLKDK